MTIEVILFVALIALTLYNNGVQAYIHFEAYPLIAYVGKSEFATYMKEYEGRLAMPLLAPYGLTVLSNVALVFLRPPDVNVLGVIIALVLNLAVAGVTLGVATPVYNRVKEAGEAKGADMSRLMSLNLWRLVLSTLASLVVLVLLVSVLT